MSAKIRCFPLPACAFACLMALAPFAACDPTPGAPLPTTVAATPNNSAQPLPLTGDRRILHALNRLTFGPRPGDIASIRATGLDRWIAAQLDPENIDDDATDHKLEALRDLNMPRWQLMALYAYDNRQPRRDDSLLFGPDDLPHPAALLLMLRNPKNPLTPFMKTQLGSATWTGLTAFSGKSDPSAGLLGMLIGDLNRLLRDESIYQKFRRAGGDVGANGAKFGLVTLATDTQKAVHRPLLGDDLVRLNRTLFEEAYPGQFKKLADREEDAAMAKAKTMDLVDALNTEELKGGLIPETSVLYIPALRKGESNQALGQLVADKLVRAIESKRQLQEVMVDFWSNHFNVDINKGPVRVLKIVDDREVIRPYVFGKFRDLLGASAKSPAMLQYLDNVESTSAYQMPANQPTQGYVPPNPNAPKDAPPPDSDFASPNILQADVPAPPAPHVMSVTDTTTMDPTAMNNMMAAMPHARKTGGLNENYAREIMELHTLGVSGGYTQKDVQEVARCFTGWGFNGAGKFTFNPQAHDAGPKIVLGHFIAPNGGIQDGEKVLDILASHPSTAHYLAVKLCQRLVADEPPASLVDAAAKTYLDTGGDLRAMLKTVITAPEFYSSAYYRAKIKSPLEYAISAVRAVDGTYAFGAADRVEYPARRRQNLPGYIANMGQPIFSHLTPDGYPEDSRKWISTGGLIARLNYAVALSHDMVSEVRVVPGGMFDQVSEDNRDLALGHVIDHILGGDITPGTQAALDKIMPAGKPIDPWRTTALLLGSPEFQRH